MSVGQFMVVNVKYHFCRKFQHLCLSNVQTNKYPRCMIHHCWVEVNFSARYFASPNSSHINPTIYTKWNLAFRRIVISYPSQIPKFDKCLNFPMKDKFFALFIWLPLLASQMKNLICTRLDIWHIECRGPRKRGRHSAMPTCQPTRTAKFCRPQSSSPQEKYFFLW